MKLLRRCEDLRALRKPSEAERKALEGWLKRGANPSECLFKALEFLGEDCPCETLIEGYGREELCPVTIYPLVTVTKLVKSLLNVSETRKSPRLTPRTRSRKSTLVRRH